MTYEEAISELETIKRVYANMRKEYKPCVEALQVAIDLLKQADAPQTMYYPQVDGITPSVLVADTPQTEVDIEDIDRRVELSYRVCGMNEPQTDCDWK